MKALKWLVIHLLLFVNICSYAQALPPKPEKLNQSQQLIVVVTSDFDSMTAYFQLFQRENNQKPWKAMGHSIPAILGRNGLAWGDELRKYGLDRPFKQEGDGKTPAGVYLIRPAFGFVSNTPTGFKLPYLNIRSDTVCVNDPRSKYYNQIVNTNELVYLDWQTAEQMRDISGYLWGAVINYNTKEKTPYAGSCIFLHVFKKESIGGTAGCITLREKDLYRLLLQLDIKLKPVILILPIKIYRSVQADWGLPQLEV